MGEEAASPAEPAFFLNSEHLNARESEALPTKQVAAGGFAGARNNCPLIAGHKEWFRIGSPRGLQETIILIIE